MLLWVKALGVKPEFDPRDPHSIKRILSHTSADLHMCIMAHVYAHTLNE